MKLLRNPWVTGALSVVALGAICYQLLPRRPQATVPTPQPGAVPTPPETKPLPLPEALAHKSNEFGEGTIDTRYAQTHMSEWLDSPRRDPFLLAGASVDKSAGQSASPVTKWTLKAIWRQTGNRVAAINDRVYAEGDSIDGYRVDRIEGDGVWFEGPLGKERLRFQAGQKSTNANATANISSIPSTGSSNRPSPAARP